MSRIRVECGWDRPGIGAHRLRRRAALALATLALVGLSPWRADQALAQAPPSKPSESRRGDAGMPPLA